MRIVFTFLACLIFAMTAQPADAPKMTPEQQKATDTIHQYFRTVTERLQHQCLNDVNSLDDWKTLQPKLREQMLYMLGLSPLPAKTDLKATITGTVEGDEFIVEKLHYQSMPGLYVTGNFYRPKKADGPLPTILYVCGHSTTKINGIAYGAKTTYQHHASWFARHGYNCLIIDTLQLGEIEGLHHGTYREGMWWWPARGYTSEGVEAWNCVRALDYLETRREVDMKKIGITGRSGGGAYSWFTAAIDDRIACSVPVAGITDLENHVVDGTIEGHCDCMFMVNTYQWDFGALAALTAPRPLLFSNSDKDTIFPLNGVYRTHAKVKKIYDLLKAPDKLGLLITEGPHSDTQDLQVPAFRWFNRWLKRTSDQITRAVDKPFDAKQLRVFAELPKDERNTRIHETFVPKAAVPMPRSKSEWELQREGLIKELKDKSFRAWPEGFSSKPSKPLATKDTEGIRFHGLECRSEENVTVPIYVVSSAKTEIASLLVVNVVDNDGWKEWLGEFAAPFLDAIPGNDVKPNHEAFAANAKMIDKNNWAFAVVAPRGIGPNQWNPDAKKDTQILRRFILLGSTADSGRVWDIRSALRALRGQGAYRRSRLWLQGTGAAAGLALYAGIFEPSVERLDLHKPTVSHMSGPYFLNVLRVLDIPQAVAMVYPRQVKMYDADAKAWEWSTSVAKLYDERKPPLEMRTTK